MKQCAPCESTRRGAPDLWRQSSKINAFELCTNHDSANCQPYGQRVSSRLPDLARPRLIR
jgi:hypothetical protein